MSRRSEALAASAGEVFDSPDGFVWYVVWTHWRAEAKARAGLEQRGYAAFAPTHHVSVRHAGKSLTVERSMFPRYLFVGLSPGQSWYPITSSVAVAGLVSNHDKPVRIPPWIMRNLFRAQQEDAFSVPVEVLPVVEGQKVRFVGGPFENFVGIVQRATPGRRVSVLLEMFGQKKELSVPLADLRAA